jgi:hypothetical protein
MLVIRKEQLETFQDASAPHFEAAAIQHLKEAFPKHCTQLGEGQLRPFVQYGRERAALYGITSQAGVSLFLDLTLLLGRGFDTDFQLPWAAEILKDSTLPDEQTRLSLLHSRAMGYLDTVSGPDNEFIDEAQRRIGVETLERPSGGESFETYMLERLRAVFPQKSDYVGDEILKTLLAHAVQAARQYGLKTEQGVIVLTGLFFMLGASFDTDPVFASINSVLHDASAGDRYARSQLLHQRSLEYLKRWCG